MAIYHFSAKEISRSAGRSSVASAAYRSGECLTDDRTGVTYDYTRKRGVIFGQVILPGGGTISRQVLWDRVEAKHKRGDAMVARELEVALPHELTRQQNIFLTQRFCRYIADKYKVGVDFNLHEPVHGHEHDHAPDHRDGSDPRNIHAHCQITACYCDEFGVMGKKAVELDPIHCKRNGLPNFCDVEREVWESMCNAALQEAGLSERIDHRTLEAQGIDRIPTVHLGPVATDIERKGGISEISQRVQDEQFMKSKYFIARLERDAALELAAAEAEMDKAREILDAIVANEERLAALAAEKKAKEEAERFAKQEAERKAAEAEAAELARIEGERARVKSELNDLTREQVAYEREYKKLVSSLDDAWPRSTVERAKQKVIFLERRKANSVSILEGIQSELVTLPFWRFLRRRDLIVDIAKQTLFVQKREAQIKEERIQADALVSENVKRSLNELISKKPELDARAIILRAESAMYNPEAQKPAVVKVDQDAIDVVLSVAPVGRPMPKNIPTMAPNTRPDGHYERDI
ncbi:MAG: MobA/MobL family protein [Rhodoferax sp.]|nr:MobA/MobL family protein [Rhodoferax sp.]MCF8210365.1 MobA/MobL family protein [Rhodoferax sp.]